MNADLAHSFHRSEAFAEDVIDLVAETPQVIAQRRVSRLVNWLPLGVALLGVAFAVIPPLA
jgi:hypothetical protein